MDYLPFLGKKKHLLASCCCTDSCLCPLASVYLNWTADLLTKRHMQANFIDRGFVSGKGFRVKRLHACHKCFIISWTATATAALIILVNLWRRLHNKRFRRKAVRECQRDWHKGLGSLWGFLLKHKLDSGRLSKYASYNILGFLHSRSREGCVW